MISEPYKTDDGRVWVRSDISGETHNFSTMEEAYHFYNRMLEIQARLDGGSRTDLTRPPLTEPVQLPLSKVPETRPPHLDAPLLNTEEMQAEYERQAEAEIARIEYEEAKAGKIPMTFFMRKWIGPLAAGLGGSLLGYALKGCF